MRKPTNEKLVVDHVAEAARTPSAMPVGRGAEGFRVPPSGHGIPRSPGDLESVPREISDRASDAAFKAMDMGREGLMKAEFFYRHGRRLAGFGTRDSAVATTLAAAAVGYGIGFLLHG